MLKPLIRYWRTPVLGLFLVLIWTRAPYLFQEPRFWAEEGTQFFSYAYKNDFWPSLTYLQRGTGGYYNFPAVFGATLAAHTVPLQYAPHVTTLVSLAFLLLPIILLFWGSSFIWNTAPKKVLGAALLLLNPGNKGEVWLNTINSQVFCGITAFILLFENVDRASRKRIGAYAALLFICGLSGLYSVFLLPFFALKFLLERNRGAAVLFLSSFLASAIQIGTFLYLGSQGQLSGKKFTGAVELGRIFVSTFYFHVLYPLFGNEVGRSILASSGLHGFWQGELSAAEAPLPLIILAVSILGAFAYFALQKPRRFVYLMLVSVFLTLSLLITLGAHGHIPGGRYQVVPNFVLLTLVLSNLHLKGTRIRTGIAALLLTSSVFYGLRSYQGGEELWNCYDICPRWTDELKKWEEDPTYRLQVWPVKASDPDWRWLVSLRR